MAANGSGPRLPLSVRIDRWIRHVNFRATRASGGWLDRLTGVHRHAPSGVLLALALIFLVVWGPAPGTGPRLWFALASLALAGVLIVAMRWSQSRSTTIAVDLAIQIAILIGLSAVVYWRGDVRLEPDGRLYRHGALAGVLLFSGCALIVAFTARLWFAPRPAFAVLGAALRRCELFQRPTPPDPITWRDVLWSLVLVPVRRFLHLTFPPAAVVLLAPGTLVFGIRSALVWGVPALILNYIVLVLASSNRRLDSMIDVVESGLFRGTSLLVSAAVIALAALRLFKIDYLTTVLDSQNTAGTLTTFLLAAYVLSWWYDYWVGRLATNQLIRSFGGVLGDAVVPYPIDAGAVGTRVPVDGRVIAVHGSNRFVVTRPIGEDIPFQTYGMYQLPHRVADADPAHGPAANRALSESAWKYALTATALPVVLALGAAWLLFRGAPVPELVASGSRASLLPESIVFSPDVCRGGGHVVALAASGGGTRAAVFTAAMLEGLQHDHVLPTVKLTSGVSGGGAALAYFAGRYPTLAAGDEAAWNAFLDEMTAAYIADVLAGVSELRVMLNTRTGTLLAESFARRWAAADTTSAPRVTLGDVREIGMLWNTSLAGRDRADGSEKARTVSGRLVLTNLSFPGGLDYLHDGIIAAGTQPDDAFVLVDAPETPLSTAAALNANFPPVFSNAAVVTADGRRYWVTDGGALDNRGIESLLYALRAAIRQASWATCPQPPTIHVITADASALSTSYHQDRGIGTALGAGTVFATRLASELAAQIQSAYAGRGTVNFSYVAMPDAFRRSGAFGTHWMLQPNISVTTTTGELTLTGAEMIAAIRALFGHQNTPLSVNAQRAYDDTKTAFGDQWRAVIDRLK